MEELNGILDTLNYDKQYGEVYVDSEEETQTGNESNKLYEGLCVQNICFDYYFGNYCNYNLNMMIRFLYMEIASI